MYFFDEGKRREILKGAAFVRVYICLCYEYDIGSAFVKALLTCTKWSLIQNKAFFLGFIYLFSLQSKLNLIFFFLIFKSELVNVLTFNFMNLAHLKRKIVTTISKFEI